LVEKKGENQGKIRSRKKNFLGFFAILGGEREEGGTVWVEKGGGCRRFAKLGGEEREIIRDEGGEKWFRYCIVKRLSVRGSSFCEILWREGNSFLKKKSERPSVRRMA